MRRRLYLPEKYPVIVGRGEGIGFCTVWSDPELVLSAAPWLREKAALIGTLYSQEGVNIILRNLCLNPDIGYLIVWDKGELSRTAFGQAGLKILKALWQKGVDDQGRVLETDFLLHPEFDLKVIRRVIKNVKLIDFSDLDLKEILPRIEKLPPATPYMRSIAFPEHQPEEGIVFPSEEVGFLVRDRKLVDVWLKLVSLIMRFGLVKETEYGNQQRELPVATWVIEEEDINSPFIPDWPEKVLSKVGLKQESLEEYCQEFLSPHLPEGTVYTYGQRLRRYPGKESVVDQVEEMIAHLKKCPVTRRAVATTLYPPIDKDASSPPCIDLVQALLVNNRLCLFVVARSHDIFKAAIPNAFGLLALQKYLAEKSGYPVGKLVITSNSAHIYEEDWDDARKLISCWQGREERSASCSGEKQDPRGNLVIRVEGEEIVVSHLTKEGKTLAEYQQNGREPKAALKLAQKLLRDQVISRIDHALDIGEQLGRAEDAVKLGLKFRQDQPLRKIRRRSP